eukprot:gene23483-biopygen17820
MEKLRRRRRRPRVQNVALAAPQAPPWVKLCKLRRRRRRQSVYDHFRFQVRPVVRLRDVWVVGRQRPLTDVERLPVLHQRTRNVALRMQCETDAAVRHGDVRKAEAKWRWKWRRHYQPPLLRGSWKRRRHQPLEIESNPLARGIVAPQKACVCVLVQVERPDSGDAEQAPGAGAGAYFPENWSKRCPNPHHLKPEVVIYALAAPAAPQFAQFYPGRRLRRRKCHILNPRAAPAAPQFFHFPLGRRLRRRNRTNFARLVRRSPAAISGVYLGGFIPNSIGLIDAHHKVVLVILRDAPPHPHPPRGRRPEVVCSVGNGHARV